MFAASLQTAAPSTAAITRIADTYSIISPTVNVINLRWLMMNLLFTCPVALLS